MKIRHWFAFGALACVQLAAIAQQAPAQQRPEDPDAAVPALTYTSAFEGFSRAESQQDRTPDQAWRPANDQLANPDSGHAQHQPGQQGQAPSTPAGAPPVKHQHEESEHE